MYLDLGSNRMSRSSVKWVSRKLKKQLQKNVFDKNCFYMCFFFF